MSLGSLRAKLTAWSAMMVGVVMVASGAGALALIRYDHFTVLDDLLQAEASIFFHELHLRPNSLDQPQPEQVKDLLANSGPARFIEIIDAKGEPIYKSNNLGEASLPQGSNQPQTVNVAASRVRLRAFHEGQVTLLLGADLHDDDAATQKLELAILCGLPILIGVVSLSGWWLARKALAPIHDITAAVERITAGRLDQRLPIPGTGGDVGRLATVLNDTFDRLDDSFRQAVRFSADASHELKTPLTILRTSIEDLLESDSLPDASRGAVAALLEQTTRLSSITQSLLLLSRADAGHLKLDLKQTDLGELITACVEDAMVMAEAREISVQAHIAEQMHALVDDARLSQALLNLLDNAVKYNRHGGRVLLRAERSAKSLVVTVENTGPGILEEHAPHLFKRFYRANQDGGTPGHGLGLSLARELARAHGGDAVLVSSGPDRTVFKLTIRADFLRPPSASETQRLRAAEIQSKAL